MNRNDLLSELGNAISALLLPHTTRVAIDGVGKTTLADELVVPITQAGRTVIRASIDGFHNPRQERYVRGSDSAEGYFLDSFNYAALEQELLSPLGPGGDRSYRRAVFDYRVDAKVNTERQTAPVDAVLLLDGVFLLRPELAPHWDFTIWVDAPFEATVERAIQRDAISSETRKLRELYQRRYVPGQRIYMERCRPKQKADIIVNNTDFEAPELDLRNDRGAA